VQKDDKTGPDQVRKGKIKEREMKNKRSRTKERSKEKTKKPKRKKKKKKKKKKKTQKKTKKQKKNKQINTPQNPPSYILIIPHSARGKETVQSPSSNNRQKFLSTEAVSRGDKTKKKTKMVTGCHR